MARPKGRFRPARDVVFRELDGEMVLLNLKSGVYFGLNATGARMWTLLMEKRGSEEVVNALQQEYEAERAKLEQDLDGLLSHLLEKGLVEVDEG